MMVANTRFESILMSLFALTLLPRFAGVGGRLACIAVIRHLAHTWAVIGVFIVGWTLVTPLAFDTFGDNAFMALTIPAGLLTIGATYLAERAPPKRALWLVLGLAIVLRGYVLLFDPLLSSDIYRYVWDGRVQAAGINPYRSFPADEPLAFRR